jgi:hypothetical protein
MNLREEERKEAHAVILSLTEWLHASPSISENNDGYLTGQ